MKDELIAPATETIVAKQVFIHGHEIVNWEWLQLEANPVFLGGVSVPGKVVRIIKEDS